MEDNNSSCNASSSSSDQGEASKKIMECWINFLKNSTKQPAEEVEAILGSIIEVLNDLVSKGIFVPDNTEIEGEKYFFSNFCPELMKWIIEDTTGHKYNIIKAKQKEILLILLGQFAANIENPKLASLYEKFSLVFSDDKNFNKNFEKMDASETFFIQYQDIFNPDSARWRASFQQGALIDLLAKEPDEKLPNIFYSHWTRAEILSVDEIKKTLKLKLLGTGDIIPEVAMYSDRLFPIGTLSQDYTWRESITNGMEVDILDANKSWYLSTVLDDVTESEQKKGSIKYGERIYREGGKLEDKEKRRYYGWGESFDKEISVHSPRVRQAHEYSKPIMHFHIITTYPNDFYKYNETALYIPFEFNSFKFYAIPKKVAARYTDIIYIEIANEFIGNLRGFETFLTVLHKAKSAETSTSTSTSINYELLFTIVDIVDHLHDKLHPKFALTYLKDFWQLVSEILLNFSKTEVRNFRRDKVEKLFGRMKEILKMAYIESDLNVIFDTFGVQFGMNCIRNSTILDKKLLGIKILTDTLLECAKSLQVSAPANSPKHLPIICLLPAVLQKDKENCDIFDYLFGSQSHSQIIQKSPELIKTLFMSRVLSTNEIQKIILYAQSATDPEIRGLIYKSLVSNAAHMHLELIVFLTNQIISTNLENFTKNDIDLLIAVSKASPAYASKDSIPQVLNCFFNLIFKTPRSSLDSGLYDYIVKEYTELMKLKDFKDFSYEYVKLILQLLIECNENFIRSLKVLRHLVHSVNSAAEDNAKAILMSIVFGTSPQGNLNVVDVMIKYMLLYHTTAKKKIKDDHQGDVSPDLDLIFTNETFVNFSSHSEIITEVISFFNSIINYQKVYILTTEQISTMFYIFVENPITSKDTTLFFKWIKDAEDKKVLSDGVFELIFSKMLQDVDKFDFSNTGGEMFNCLWTIFLAINKNSGKLGTTVASCGVAEKQITTSTGKVLSSYSYSPENKVESEVKCNAGSPLQCLGFDLIWKILLCQSGDTQKKSIDSLLKLFLNNSLPREERGLVRKELIQKCMDVLRDPERKIKIVNALNILSAFIEETEKKGTAGCVSHSAILKNCVYNLKFNNNLSCKYNFGNSKDDKKFSLKVFSNISIWDLKKLVAKKLSLIPECIKFSVAGIKEIADTDHGKTLNEMKFRDGDTVSITKNSALDQIPKVALTDDGFLTEKAIKVFTEIFSEFSTNGLMSREQCAQFAFIAVDAVDQISIDDCRVKDIFEKYDLDKDNNITLDEFCMFFRDSIELEKKLSTVWCNIAAFHYRNDLKKLNEPLDDANLDNDLTSMPRYILSTDQEYFNIIFNLQDEDEFIAKEASKLLSMMCTNPVIFKDILTMSHSKAINPNDWGRYMDIGNKYKLIYSLQIIESFFEEFELFEQDVDSESLQTMIVNQEDKDMRGPSQKIAWIENFLANGGISYIIDKALLNENITGGEIIKVGINKKIYIHLVKIVKNSLSLLFSARTIDHTSQKDDFIELIRKESVNPEKVLATDDDKNINNMFNEQEDVSDEVKKEDQPEKKDKTRNEKEIQLFENLNKQLYGDSILVSINISGIISQLMHICYTIATKSENEGDEKQLISYSLNLFSLITASQEDPAAFLEKCVFNNQTLKFDEFLLCGLLKTKNSAIRAQFFRSFSNLSDNLSKMKDDSLTKALLRICDKQTTSLDSAERAHSTFLFQLFQSLISTCFKYFKNQPIPINFEAVALGIIQIINDDATISIEDELLLGYLRLLVVIFQNVDTAFKTYCGRDLGLINGLLNNFLLKDTENDSTIMQISTDSDSDTLINPNDPKFQLLCKGRSLSSDARCHIFNLLFTLMRDNIDNLIAFFSSKKISAIANYISKLSKERSYNPQSERRSMNGYLGIKNLSCICYMISVIQQFFVVPPFRYAIIQASDGLGRAYNEANPEVDDNVLHQMQKMFTYLEWSNRAYCNPSDFVYSFKDIDGRPTDYTQQCDAQEFLGRMLEKMEYLLKPTRFRYILHSVFYGETCSQLMCQNGCGKVSNRFEDLYNLSLEIRNKKTLKDSLNKYISEENIDDYYCEKCKKKTRHSKRLSISQLPNVLMIHLQRITFNYESLMMDKINTRLEFPKHLNMKNYCTESFECNQKKTSCACEDEGEIDEKIESCEDSEDEFIHRVFQKEDEYYEYDLVGIVVHTGTAQFGHYYSYINAKRDGNDDKMAFDPEKDKNKWLRFDDSTITSYNISKLEEDTFGTAGSDEKEANPGGSWVKTKSSSNWADTSKNAYMLVYERMKKSPIQILDSHHKFENDSVIKFNEKTKFKVMKPYNYFIKKDCEAQDKHLVFYNEDKDELSYYVPFYSLCRQENVKVPSSYFLNVALDNIRFVNDEKIFSKSFSLFIEKVTSLVESLMKSEDETVLALIPTAFKSIYETLNQIVLDIIAKSYFRDNLEAIVTSMSDIIGKNPSLSEVVVNYLLSAKERLVPDLLFSSEAKSNCCYKDYLVNNLVCNIKIHSDEIATKQKCNVIDLIDYLYSLFPNEVAKNWTKMVSFLDIFKELALENNDVIVSYLLEKGTIAKLIDFFLIKESPLYKKGESRNDMGNKTVAAKLAPVITAVSRLARHCRTESVSEEDISEGKGSSTFLKTEGNLVYSLSENDKKCLYCKSFYQKAIKDNYNNSELSRLLAHLMHNNLQFTLELMPLLVNSISDGLNSTDAKNSIELVFSVLGIDDSYTNIRLECLFGVPSLAVRVNDFCAPALPERNGKMHIVNYICPLYPEKDALIETLITKYKASSEFVASLAYFFGLMMKGKKIFSYLESLPHPLIDKASFMEYILSLAFTEVEKCKNSSAQMTKYKSQIEILEKMPAKYALKKEEFSKEEAIPKHQFTSVHSMRYIIRENISNMPFNEINQNNVYLLISDYDVELLNREAYPGVPSIEIEAIAMPIDDAIPGMIKEDNQMLAKTKEESEEESLKAGAIVEDVPKENEKQNIPKPPPLPCEHNGSTENTYLKQHIQEIFDHHTSPNPPLTRTFYPRIKEDTGKSTLIAPAIKRFHLFNLSEKDYLVTVKFRSLEESFNNCYIPNLEIVVIVKKSSSSTVFTFVKTDLLLPFNEMAIEITCNEYEDKNDLYQTPKKVKHSNSTGNLNNIPIPPELPAAAKELASAIVSQQQVEIGPTVNEDNGFDMDCSSCGTINRVKDDYGAQCKNCKAYLFS